MTENESTTGGASPAPRQCGILLHACCGPCSTHCVRALRDGAREPVLFFSNSNIDSREEFDRRLAALSKFADAEEIEMVVDGYDHDAWLRAVAGLEDEPEGGRRCDACFRFNLGRAAAAADGMGLGEFTTTLTVSPHKNSRRVFAAGEAAADGRKTAFARHDFKKKGGFLDSVRLSRQFGLYRQSWCGCEFSRRAAEDRAAAEA